MGSRTLKFGYETRFLKDYDSYQLVIDIGGAFIPTDDLINFL